MKKIISVLLIICISISCCACGGRRTVEDARASANNLLIQWNDEAYACCSYEAEFEQTEGKRPSYTVFARFYDAVNESQYADFVRSGLIQDIFKEVYAKVEKEFEGHDVDVVVLVMDKYTLYCGMEDGEILYMDE